MARADAAGVLPYALGPLACDGARGVGQQQDKFFAPVAAGGVGAADVGAQHGAQLAQQRVAERVAVSVVEALEVVDVDHHHPQRALGALGSAQLALKGFFQVAPIE